MYILELRNTYSLAFIFRGLGVGRLQHCENSIILYIIHFNSSSGCLVHVHRKKKPINVIAMKWKAYCVTLHFIPACTERLFPLDGSVLTFTLQASSIVSFTVAGPHTRVQSNWIRCRYLDPLHFKMSRGKRNWHICYEE